MMLISSRGDLEMRIATIIVSVSLLGATAASAQDGAHHTGGV
jgi:hypothetical protein